MPSSPPATNGKASLKSSSFHIDGKCRDLRTDRTDQDQRHGNRRRQDVEPDPQRHQRRCRTRRVRRRSHRRARRQAGSRRWRRPSSFLVIPGWSAEGYPESRDSRCIASGVHAPGMTSAELRRRLHDAADRYYRNRSLQQQPDGNGPMSATASKTFLVCHGAWSAGWAWKKMHPLMQAAGHRLVTRPTPGSASARILAQSGDRSRLAYRGHARTSSSTRICATSCWSATAMAAWSPPASPTAPATRSGQLIYVDAFVPGRRPVAARSGTRWRGRACRKLSKTGDGWRVPPEPDTAGYVAGRRRMADGASRRHADQNVLKAKLKLLGGPLTLPRSYHLRHAHHAGRYVRAVCQNDEERSRLELLRRSTPATRRTSPRRRR